jgi:hypothetical protein
MSIAKSQRAGGLVSVPVACLALAGCGSNSAPDGASRPKAPVTTQAASVTRSSVVLPAPRKSRAARVAARDCGRRSARQVRATYEKTAAAHAAAPDRRFLRIVTAQHAPTTAPLAARIYAMSVPKSSRVDAYVACAHVLSLKESSR